MSFNSGIDQKGKTPFSGSIYPEGKREGTIVAYDPDSDSYTVALEGEPGNPNERRGRVLKSILRRKGASGVHNVLPAHLPVIVDFGLRNQPYITGILNKNASRTATEQAVGSPIDAGGGFFNTQSETLAGGYYREPGAPKDMLPGDHFFTTPDGNYISIQAGKMNKIFGSERAQVIVSGNHDAVRVVCENYEHLSALGEMRIQTMNGRASMSFRGRVDQKTQRDDGKGCVAFDIGDTGNLVRLQILDNAGRMLSQQQFSPTGKILLLSTEDIVNVCSVNRREEIGKDRYVYVKFNDTKDVGGKQTTDIAGGWSVSVGSSGLFTYGQDLSHVANNNYLLYTGGNVTNTVTGGPVLSSLPTNVAVAEKILNGSHVKFIGFPNHMADPSGKAMAGYRCYMYNGAVVFGDVIPLDQGVPPFASMMNGVCLNTPKPDSIGLGGITAAMAALLGGAPATAVDPAVKFIELQAFLTALLTALDTHTHPTAWGPSGPAIAGPVNGGLFNGAVGGLVAAIQSSVVKMFA